MADMQPEIDSWTAGAVQSPSAGEDGVYYLKMATVLSGTD